MYDPQQNVFFFVNLSHFTVKTLEDVEQIRTTVAQNASRWTQARSTPSSTMTASPDIRI